MRKSRSRESGKKGLLEIRAYGRRGHYQHQERHRGRTQLQRRSTSVALASFRTLPVRSAYPLAPSSVRLVVGIGQWLGGTIGSSRAIDMKHSCRGNALAAMVASCALLGAAAFVVPLSQQQAGRAVSPTVQSYTSVSRRAGQRRARSYQMCTMSETTGDKERAVTGGALPTDISPERKEEVLTVLSAVIDPGEKALCCIVLCTLDLELTAVC